MFHVKTFLTIATSNNLLLLQEFLLLNSIILQNNYSQICLQQAIEIPFNIKIGLIIKLP
jgi:hypothetical protein